MASCSRFTIVAARHLSTTSAAGALIRPPLQVYGLGGRYATALYSAASKEKQLDIVDKELTTLQDVLVGNDKMAAFVMNPAVKKRNKLGVLQDFMKEKKMSPMSSNFVGLLTENNRLNKLKDVLNAWTTIMSSHRGEIVCNIKTAKPLDASQQKQLEAALQGFVKKTDKLKVNTQIDASLIGGMVVEIGDKYVDMSVATKVKKMAELIQAPV